MQNKNLIQRLTRSYNYKNLFYDTGNPIFFSASVEVRNGADLTLHPVEIENEIENTL